MAKNSAAKHSSDYRQRVVEKNAALGIEKLTVEVSQGMTQGLECLMREHGFAQRQEVYQNLLRHVLSLDYDEAAKLLHPITSAFDISPKLARQFRNASLKELRRDPGDEHLIPVE